MLHPKALLTYSDNNHPPLPTQILAVSTQGDLSGVGESQKGIWRDLSTLLIIQFEILVLRKCSHGESVRAQAGQEDILGSHRLIVFSRKKKKFVCFF